MRILMDGTPACCMLGANLLQLFIFSQTLFKTILIKYNDINLMIWEQIQNASSPVDSVKL